MQAASLSLRVCGLGIHPRCFCACFRGCTYVHTVRAPSPTTFNPQQFLLWSEVKCSSELLPGSYSAIRACLYSSTSTRLHSGMMSWHLHGDTHYNMKGLPHGKPKSIQTQPTYLGYSPHQGIWSCCDFHSHYPH